MDRHKCKVAGPAVGSGRTFHSPERQGTQVLVPADRRPVPWLARGPSEPVPSRAKLGGVRELGGVGGRAAPPPERLGVLLPRVLVPNFSERRPGRSPTRPRQGPARPARFARCCLQTTSTPRWSQFPVGASGDRAALPPGGGVSAGRPARPHGAVPLPPPGTPGPRQVPAGGPLPRPRSESVQGGPGRRLRARLPRGATARW